MRNIVTKLYLHVRFPKASGGLSIYWAIMIAVIIISGYLVGGLIPSRKSPTVSGQPMSFSPPAFKRGMPVLQLGSLQVGGCRGLPAVLFLIDASDTMRRTSPGSDKLKIDLVKTGLLYFASRLTDKALVGIIDYSDGEPAVRLRFRELGSNRENFQTVVTGLGAEGLSYFRGGMEAASTMLGEEMRARPEYNYNLIIITDGIPETAECAVNPSDSSCVCKGSLCFAKAQDPTAEPSVAKKIQDMGVSIYTIGIGPDTPSEAAFTPEYQTMLQTAASKPTSRYYVYTQNASNLNDILSTTGSSLCLDTKNVQ